MGDMFDDMIVLLVDGFFGDNCLVDCSVGVDVKEWVLWDYMDAKVPRRKHEVAQ